MNNLLDIIKEELKDVHIEDGTNQAFDRVCEQLRDRLLDYQRYLMGPIQRVDLLMILSRFEGYIMSNKISDKYINEQLDRAVSIIREEPR